MKSEPVHLSRGQVFWSNANVLFICVKLCNLLWELLRSSRQSMKETVIVDLITRREKEDYLWKAGQSAGVKEK